MSSSLINKATSVVPQLLGQSRYRVEVHECSEFLDVLHYSAVESLSQPWRYDVAVTSSSVDIACGAFTAETRVIYFPDPGV